jgi:uncharacterized protein (TIGR01619 family)
MSDNWDFYLCQVEGEPASIFLDIGIANSAPLPERPFMCYVRVQMRAPRPDGLSSEDEYAELSRLEDHLTEALTKDGEVLYVGRNTSGGQRDFYFYAASKDHWDMRVADAMSRFAKYRFECGTQLDEDWASYFGFLFPSAEDLERIQNRRVCDALEREGDALTEPREIDHWAYFPDESSRDRFVAAILAQGFTLRSLTSTAEADRAHGVQFFRVDVPSFESIDEVTLPLYRAATEAGGDYDGWDAQVMK